MLLLAFALGTTFLVVNFLHFRLFEVSVILYACVVDAIVASIDSSTPYLRFAATSGG